MNMQLRNHLVTAVLVGAVILATAGMASAQNILANPGFELGLTSWITFGNVVPETTNPPAVVPHAGSGNAKMWGLFNGQFNVGGMFQEFPAVPGSYWQMSSWARHWSGDMIHGIGAAGGVNNWVVQKIAFFDAGGEIGGVESTILDGTYATDMWHGSGTIFGTAPAGTIKVQALILFLQPLFEPGAAHIDDVFFGPASVPTENKTWGAIKDLYQ
jgi:hypothetical protein